MKQKKQIVSMMVVALLCISLLFVFTACNNVDTGSDNSEKVLTMGFSVLPVNLNTLERNDDAIFDIIYPAICQYDDDGTVHMILAKSMEASEGSLVYTLKLHETGWSDGTPLTADDIIFTVKNICNPNATAVATSRFAIFEGTNDTGHSVSNDGNIEGIKKIDNHTIEFTCKYPVNEYVFYDAMMFLRPQPMHILKDVTIEQFPTHELFQTASVTSGPYVAVNYVQNQYMELVPNEHYYAAPKIDRIFVKIVDEASMVAQLETGEIDMNALSLAYSDIELVKSLSNVNVVIPEPMPVFRYLIINCKTINNAKVRQAISYALDRKAMVEAILNGAGRPTSGPYNKDNLFYNEKYQTPYNPEKAKELLAESGWDTSKPIMLRGSSRSAMTQQMAEMSYSYLTDIGLNIDLQMSDHATLLSSTRNGDYDITAIGYGWTPFEPNVTVFYGTGGSFNLSKYSNPKMDELLTAGLAEVDTQKRKLIYDELQALFMEEMPCTLLFGEQRVHAYNKRLVNYTPKAYGILNNITEWDIVE